MSRNAARPEESAPKELTEDEQIELELAERARIASDSWDTVAP